MISEKITPFLHILGNLFSIFIIPYFIKLSLYINCKHFSTFYFDIGSTKTIYYETFFRESYYKFYYYF